MPIQELNADHMDEIKKRMLDIFSGPPWYDAWTDEQLHAYISEWTGNKNALSFGLFQNGRLIGIALGRIKNWYTGTEYWIDEFGILPAMQHSGLGSEFMEAIEKALAEKGIRQVVLLTERHVPAYHFYRKNGFEEKEDTVFFVKSI